MTGSGEPSRSDDPTTARDRAGNELFPSADWRYLLPDPAPATVAVAATGPLGRIAGRLAADTTDRDERADLGVADRADPATIRRLVALVRPGGSVYIELPWPRYLPAGRLSRRLIEAGLLDPQVYSLSPSGDRWSPSWWIPVGSPDAIRFVADQLASATGIAPSIRNRLRTVSIGPLVAAPALAAAQPWLLHPVRGQRLCAIARTPSSDGSPSSEPGLLPPSGGPVERRRFAVMRVGGSSTDQAMIFGLGDGHQAEVVVKAPTRSEELAASEHEAEVLARLAEGPNPVPGVPRIVALPVGDRVAAWGQSFADGPPLARRVDPTNLERHGRAMTRWLAELARRGPVDGPLDTIGSSVFGASVLDELAPLFVGADLGGRAAERLHGLGPLRPVIQHRDLGPWNVMVDEDQLQVIDWADATLAGVPLCDLHHFLVHLALCAFDAYEPERRRSVIADLTDPRSTLGRLLDDCLDSYAGEVGLTIDQVEGLRVLTWLLDLVRRPPDERTGSIYLELLVAELDRGPAASTLDPTRGAPARPDQLRSSPVRRRSAADVVGRVRNELVRRSSWRP